MLILYVAKRRDYVCNRAKTLLGNSVGWTKHLNNTNIHIGTTELYPKMYMCQLNFVNI